MAADVRLDGVPFAAAVQAIRDGGGGAAIDVDWPALHAVGVDPATPVTLRAPSATVAGAVAGLVRAVDVGGSGDDPVAAVPGDDRRSVRLTSHRLLLASRVTREYPVGDLVGSEETAAHSFGDLALYVRQTVAPGSWDDDGGDVGTMDADAARFVLRVTQTPENHRRIAAALASLRTPARVPVTRP